MRRIVLLLLALGLLSIPTVGVTGCGGGTETGTHQISEKATPDPETLNAELKAGTQKGRSR